MKPRELLTEQLCEAVIADDPVEELALRLETYAIGRWVPVSERLPDTEDDGFWSGFIRSNDGSVVADFWKPTALHKTDNWLELQLPEVSQ